MTGFLQRIAEVLGLSASQTVPKDAAAPVLVRLPRYQLQMSAGSLATLNGQLADAQTFDEIFTAVRSVPEEVAAQALGAALDALLDGQQGAGPAFFDGIATLKAAIDRALRGELAQDELLWTLQKHEPYDAFLLRERLILARQQIGQAGNVDGEANADVLAGILLMDVRAVPLPSWPMDLETSTHAWIGELEQADVVTTVQGTLGGELDELYDVPSVLGLRHAVEILRAAISPRRRADFAAAWHNRNREPTERVLRPEARDRRDTQTITIPAIGLLPDALRRDLLPFVQAAVQGELIGEATLELERLQHAVDALAQDKTVALPSHFTSRQQGQTFRSLYQAYVNQDPDATRILTGRLEVWTEELIAQIKARGGFAPQLLGWLWGGGGLQDSVETGRFYLPVKREHAAAVWCGLELAIFPKLKELPRPPMFKMGPTLRHFQRSDAAVVYAHRTAILAVWEVLQRWVGQHREHFRDARPLFTAQVLDDAGEPLPIAFGQSAPLGRSFGEHRANLVARAVRHIRKRLTKGVPMDLESMLWAIATSLQRGHVDLDNPAFLCGNPRASGVLGASGVELFADLMPHLRRD